MKKEILRRTWAEVNLDNLTENYEKLRRQMGPNAKFMGIVKADAYGHGAIRVALKLEQLGADYLAISNLEEAQELRRNQVNLPILLLGYTPAEMTRVLIDNQVTQDVSCLEIAQAYSREAHGYGKTLKVHLKLDTGMGRLGFLCDESHYDESLQQILKTLELPGLDWEGVFTHFCVADEPDNPVSREFTKLQFDRFTRMVSEVEKRSGVQFRLHHCSNSGGVMFYPEFSWDMCRPGVVLYGTEPMSAQFGLKPVLTLKTTVGPIKEYGPDTSISYGRTYFTDQPSRVGVLPIGYADGLFRSMSNRWSMMTKDGPAPILGRVCMDMCMVDLTKLPNVQTGDEVVVFGEGNPVEKMAEMAGTITYEMLCALSRRVPRVYIEGGKVVGRDLKMMV